MSTSQTSGCPQCGSKTKSPRFLPQHRRFFALVKVAMDNWPEHHWFQPVDEQHLRRWLTCKAGYHAVTTIDLDGDHQETGRAAVRIAESAIRASGGVAFVRPHGTALAIFTPLSISFARMKHQAFCDLCDRVANVIAREIGASADDLIREAA